MSLEEMMSSSAATNGLAMTTAANTLLYNIPTEVFNVLMFWVYCVTIPVLSVCGILGNCLTVAIITHHGLKDTTNILLTFLALSDLLYSITEFLNCTSLLISQFDLPQAYTFHAYHLAYVNTWNMYTVATSSYLVALISLDRMIAVWLPFQAGSILTPARTTITAAVVCCCLFIIYCFDFPSYYIQWLHSSEYNKTIAVVSYSEFRLKNTSFFAIINKINMIFIMMCVPPTTIVTCSVMIVARLVQSSQQARKMSIKSYARRVKDIKTVKISLALCVCMITLTLIPSYSSTMLIYTGFPASGNFQRVIAALINILFQVNASINFIIYVKMSSKFASTYLQLLSICIRVR
ncbi:FMRFamide receptor-like [Physella acuta]|uniref:FMRFamide receptor-like n=1 Tax=Physella acuta TaxID=109671 RepID=UPI0027DBB034|nr:FMRFamide receptor-like [Physella acuta]